MSLLSCALSSPYRMCCYQGVVHSPPPPRRWKTLYKGYPGTCPAFMTAGKGCRRSWVWATNTGSTTKPKPSAPTKPHQTKGGLPPHSPPLSGHLLGLAQGRVFEIPPPQQQSPRGGNCSSFRNFLCPGRWSCMGVHGSHMTMCPPSAKEGSFQAALFGMKIMMAILVLMHLSAVISSIITNPMHGALGYLLLVSLRSRWVSLQPRSVCTCM